MKERQVKRKQINEEKIERGQKRKVLEREQKGETNREEKALRQCLLSNVLYTVLARV